MPKRCGDRKPERRNVETQSVSEGTNIFKIFKARIADVERRDRFEFFGNDALGAIRSG